MFDSLTGTRRDGNIIDFPQMARNRRLCAVNAQFPAKLKRLLKNYFHNEFTSTTHHVVTIP